MENQNTDNFEVEEQNEDSFEVEDVEETEDIEEEEEEVEVNPLEDEVAHLKSENAKLQRLLKKKSPAKKEVKEDGDTPSEYVTKADLERIRLESKGLSEKQVDFALKYGGLSALSDPYLKKAIDEIAQEEKQLNQTATSKKGGDVSKKYSLNQIRNMPTDKLEQLIREGKIKNL